MTDTRFSMVSIDVTDRCDLRCHHCRSHLGAFEAPTTSVLRMVNSIAEVNPRIVVLSGGEPLLRNDIFEIIGAVHSIGAALQLNTNGLHLTQATAERLANSGVEYVQVSIDGPKAVHDAIRGRGTWDRAILGCRQLTSPVELIINTTVSRFNLPYVEELGEILLGSGSSLPIDIWGLKRYVPFNNLGGQGALGPTGLAHLARLWEVLRARYPAATIKTDIPQTNRLNRVRVRRVMERYGITCAGCAAGVECLTVRANGDVSPCPTLYVNCGNILEQSMDQILDHPILRLLANRSSLQALCGSCEDKAICGGCRAVANVMSGDLFAADPECFESPAFDIQFASRSSANAPPARINGRRRLQGGSEGVR